MRSTLLRAIHAELWCERDITECKGIDVLTGKWIDALLVDNHWYVQGQFEPICEADSKVDVTARSKFYGIGFENGTVVEATSYDDGTASIVESDKE